MLEEGVGRASALRILSRHACASLGSPRATSWPGAWTKPPTWPIRRGGWRTSTPSRGTPRWPSAWWARPRRGPGRASGRRSTTPARSRGPRARDAPLEALCQLGLGDLARRRGDGAAAKAPLTAAASLLREMGMRYWLAQAEAALRD